MGLTWVDWLRFIVTPLIIASLTAIVSTRNARKTPHERLKNLVDIHKNMPDNLDSKKVVEGAIARELVDFDRRLAADQLGFWASVKERTAQLRVPLNLAEAVALAVLIIGLVFGLQITVADLGADGKSLLVKVLSGAAFAILVIGWVGGVTAIIRASRKERESLTRDRLAAEIAAQLPRVLIQAVAGDGTVEVEPGKPLFGEIQRLVEMDVFEREVQNNSGGGRPRVLFTLTEFGKDVFGEARSIAERQHVAHWENVARQYGDDAGSERSGS